MTSSLVDLPQESSAEPILRQAAEILSQQHANVVFQKTSEGGLFRRSSISLRDIPTDITYLLASLAAGEFLLALRLEHHPKQIVSALRRCLQYREPPVKAFTAEKFAVFDEKQFKKILMIAPYGNYAGGSAPVIVPHPGIEKVTAFLLTHCIDVDARTFNPNLASPMRLKKLLTEEFFHIIGISLLSTTLINDAEIIDLVATSCPNTLLIGGGPNMRHLPYDQIRAALPIDILVEGTGELTLAKITERIPLAGKHLGMDLVERFGDLPNLIIFDHQHDRTVITRHNYLSPPLPDVDLIQRNVPYDYDDLTHGTHYRARKEEVGQAAGIPYHMIGNRPYFIRNSDLCLHHCNFCFISRENAKPTGPKAVVREMANALYSGNIYDSIHFIDNDFFVFSDEVAGICKEITAQKLSDVPKYCKGCADEINPILLSTLKEAGFRMIGYGIESFDDRVLVAMNKQITVAQNEAALRWTLEAGLKPGINLITFSPWETLDTLQFTLERALYYAAHGAYINLMPLMCVNLGDDFSADPTNWEMIEYTSLHFRSTGRTLNLPTRVRLRPDMAQMHSRVREREEEIANDVRRIYRTEQTTLSQAIRSLTFAQAYFELLQLDRPSLANRFAPRFELIRRLIALTLTWEARNIIFPDKMELQELASFVTDE